jgi:creatinine amidohydrolase
VRPQSSLRPFAALAATARIGAMPTSRRLADLAAPDVARLLTERSVLVQPVGAVEQHGPHLPLSTDLVIAEEMAARVVAQRGDELDLWLLPALAYTKSNEHAWAPGTVWLSAQTMLAVLDDVGRSLATLPARRLAFINGHGGNTQLLAVANRELRLAHGLMTFLLHPRLPRDSGGAATAADDELGMGIHAGRDETSIMLHLRPQLVDMAKAARAVPEQIAANEHVTFGGTVAFGWLSDDLHPSGVIGDPTLASAELGARLVDEMVGQLGDELAEVAAFEFPAG